MRPFSTPSSMIASRSCWVIVLSPRYGKVHKTLCVGGLTIRLKYFERQRHRLAAAQAERCDATATAAPHERVDQCHEYPRAARADRVAQRDRAAVDVQTIPV